tara:strand:- start:1656 stop:1865 length:210 start_codon:yes stop_codon:yes gene_type:complete
MLAQTNSAPVSFPQHFDEKFLNILSSQIGENSTSTGKVPFRRQSLCFLIKQRAVSLYLRNALVDNVQIR